jgi:hypothetical protein
MRPLAGLAVSALVFAAALAPAAAQWREKVAVADAADLVAVYARHVERRLVRVVFDRAAKRATVLAFAANGAARFAVGPRGAFAVLAGSDERGATLTLVDGAGTPIGAPVRHGLGAVAFLAVSPRGDAVAATNERGWVAVFAVVGTGKARRIEPRAVFGAAPSRDMTLAFRPEGGLATLTDDWVVTHRALDGRVERRLDLTRTARDLVPADPGDTSALSLVLSSRRDRFAVIAGTGPFFASVYDAAGRPLPFAEPDRPAGRLATGAMFAAGGARLLVWGMEKPDLIDMTTMKVTPLAETRALPIAMTVLDGGSGLAGFDAEGGVALWDGDGRLVFEQPAADNLRFGHAEPGATNEAVVVAKRAGWVDLYSKDGRFLRRIQTGAVDEWGAVALSPDGGAVAAYGSGTLGVVSADGAKRWTSIHAPYGSQDFFVAIAADGGRVATLGPNAELRSWTGDGRAGPPLGLAAAGHETGRVAALAMTPKGDALAVADDRGAVWLADPADGRVRRVAVPGPARAVAALADGAGFVVGLANGSILRLGRDGAPIGDPVKAAEWGPIGRVVPAPDGQSLVVVEADDTIARHLSWDGRALAPPFRARVFERIVAAYFHAGEPVLLTMSRREDEGGADTVYRQHFGDREHRRFKAFERPRP